MKEIKTGVGIFGNIEELEKAIREDNEKPRRKMKCYNKIRNAVLLDTTPTRVVWFYSQGYGINFIYDVDIKNDLLDN
jgi:hypothetical protein